MNKQRLRCTVLTMPKAKKKKFYAVAIGRKTGIYNTWDECEMQVSLVVILCCLATVNLLTWLSIIVST